jgi:hypothetical protein
MTYFRPREEQNKLRKKQNMIAWRHQARNTLNLSAEHGQVNGLAPGN